MGREIKDTAELIMVNATGVGFSLLNIDAFLRTLILLGTLVYTILKIAKYLKFFNDKDNAKKEKTK